jgi:hypothetical protein
LTLPLKNSPKADRVGSGFGGFHFAEMVVTRHSSEFSGSGGDATKDYGHMALACVRLAMTLAACNGSDELRMVPLRSGDAEIECVHKREAL